MSDRFLVWLSAGVLTAGVSAATVVRRRRGDSAGRRGAGADGNTTSQSSDSPDGKADSDGSKTPNAAAKPNDDADSVDQDDADDGKTGGDETPAGDTEDDEVVDGDENDDVATDAKDADGGAITIERWRTKRPGPARRCSVSAETVEGERTSRSPSGTREGGGGD